LANHKSAEKRMKQSRGRRVRNVSAKTLVKTRIKALLKAVEENDREKSVDALFKASSVIAKASAKGVLHKNNAARKISRLTRKVNDLS
jgi:small subunit ribosomal protein S20